MSLSTNVDRGGSRTSLGSRRGDYASTESLHMTPAPPVNALPPTDENAEVHKSDRFILFIFLHKKSLHTYKHLKGKTTMHHKNNIFLKVS